MSDEAFTHEEHVTLGGLLKEAVFGFNDGLVSTFAVIAGLTGGVVGNSTVLLAALATLFAGAFSMGLGTYLGSKSERDLYDSERRRELYEMKHMPEIERQEIRDIYEAKGFGGELLEKVVHHITSDDKVWLETMMREELGYGEKPPKPGLNGVVMSVAFLAGAIIPTIPYLLPETQIVCVTAPCTPAEVFIMGLPQKFFISLIFSIIALLAAGAFKTKFTKKNAALSALETLIIGALAAGGSYGIGVLLT